MFLFQEIVLYKYDIHLNMPNENSSSKQKKAFLVWVSCYAATG